MGASGLQDFQSQLVLAEEDGSDMPEGEGEASGQDLISCRCADCPLVFVEQSLAELPLRAVSRLIIEVENVVADGMTVKDVQEHAVGNAADHGVQACFRLETELCLTVMLAGAAAPPAEPMVEMDVRRQRGFAGPPSRPRRRHPMAFLRGSAARYVAESLMTKRDMPDRSPAPGRQRPE